MKSNFNQIAAGKCQQCLLGRPATAAPGHPGGRRRADTSGLGSIYPATASGTGTFGVSGHFAGFRISVDFSAEIESENRFPEHWVPPTSARHPKKNSGSSTPKNDPPALPTGKNLLAGEGRFGTPVDTSTMVAGNLRPLKIKGERPLPRDMFVVHPGRLLPAGIRNLIEFAKIG